MLLFLFAVQLLENLKLERQFACFYWIALSGLLLCLPPLLSQMNSWNTCMHSEYYSPRVQSESPHFLSHCSLCSSTAKPFHVWGLDSLLPYGYLEMLLSFKVPLGHPHIMPSLPPCLHCTTSVPMHCDVFVYRPVDWKLLEMRGHILFYCISLHSGTWLALNRQALKPEGKTKFHLYCDKHLMQLK